MYPSLPNVIGPEDQLRERDMSEINETFEGSHDMENLTTTRIGVVCPYPKSVGFSLT